MLYHSYLLQVIASSCMGVYIWTADRTCTALNLRQEAGNIAYCCNNRDLSFSMTMPEMFIPQLTWDRLEVFQTPVPGNCTSKHFSTLIDNWSLVGTLPEKSVVGPLIQVLLHLPGTASSLIMQRGIRIMWYVFQLPVEATGQSYFHVRTLISPEVLSNPWSHTESYFVSCPLHHIHQCFWNNCCNHNYRYTSL